MEAASRKGVPSHKTILWVKRKVGRVYVERLRGDGVVGCSVPCVSCRKMLVAFDLVVVCTDSDGNRYKGKMDAPGAPASKLTSGQLVKFRGNSKSAQV
jgi:hypothetical protein